MSFEKTRLFLEKLGMGDRIFEFEVSSATVELAAKALGCPPERIAKTLAFRASGEVVLIVAAGDVKVDNAKYKNRFGTKASMIPFEETEALTGHAPGGVCPFALKEGVCVYLDESLKRFDCLYPACGSSNSAVKLTLSELEYCTGTSEWVNVCKSCRNEGAD